jgi:hypothetical protein
MAVTVDQNARGARVHGVYDQGADVLYVSSGNLEASEGEDEERGLVLRFARGTGRPIGATVIGLRRNEWSVDELALRISAHLGLTSHQIRQAIASAIAGPDEVKR